MGLRGEGPTGWDPNVISGPGDRMDEVYPDWAPIMIIFFLASLGAILVLMLTLMSRFYKPHGRDLESGLHSAALYGYPSKSPSLYEES